MDRAGRAVRHLVTGAVLAALIALAVALRVHHLGAESLWLDEAVSVDIASDPPADVVRDAIEDVHPPLYYLLLHEWLRIAGRSERAVRSLSVAASLIAVFAVVAFATRWFDRRTAALAALLAAISPLQIAFAQEGRMYALLTLMALLSLDAFLCVIRRGTTRALLAFVLATGAMLYTHVYGGFVVIAEALWLVGAGLARPKDRARWWRRGALALGLAALLFVPWLPSFFYQLRGVERGFWIADATTLTTALSAQGGSATLACFFISGLLIALVEEARQVGRPGEGRDWGVAAVTLCAVTVLSVIGLPFLLSRISRPIFLPKYTIAASLAFIVLSARGLARVPWRFLRVALVGCIVILTWLPLESYYNNRHKDDWRKVVGDLERGAEPGDLVVLSRSFGILAFDYYVRRTDLVELPFPDTSGGLTTLSLQALGQRAVGPYDRVWVVASDSDESTAALRTSLDGFEQAGAITSASGSSGVEARLYVRRDAPRRAP